MEQKTLSDRTVLDIISHAEEPLNRLSNFYENSFVIDGVKCASIEAKSYFRHSWSNLRWKLTGNLYWRGERIKRNSDAYQALLDRAYDALSQNKTFSDALAATGQARLIHSIGKQNPAKTVLTEFEFIERLTRLRNGERLSKLNGDRP